MRAVTVNQNSEVVGQTAKHFHLLDKGYQTETQGAVLWGGVTMHLSLFTCTYLCPCAAATPTFSPPGINEGLSYLI